MDTFVQILIQYGYVGMIIASFLAGTVIPFNAELVMAGLSVTGLQPVKLVLCGTIGSVAGCMVNYYLGYLGKLEWLEKMGVKPETLEKARRFVQNRGPWMAIFTFLPFIGNAIGITLGIMHANQWKIIAALIISRGLLYSLFAFGPKLIF